MVQQELFSLALWSDHCLTKEWGCYASGYVDRGTMARFYHVGRMGLAWRPASRYYSTQSRTPEKKGDF